LKVKILQHQEERTNRAEELEETIALLVLERGAEWPSWGTGVRMRAENSAVEVQMDAETTEEFQKRVFARLAHIEKKGMRLVAAGYACALLPETSDEKTVALRSESRKTICAGILRQLGDRTRPGDRGPSAEKSLLSDKGTAELILAGGAWEITGHEGRQRGELIELWSELSVRVPGRLVSVRFEDPPSESGVFRAAPKLTPLDSEADEPEGPSPVKAAPRVREGKRISESGIS
jgi:hypothetical protein